MKTTDINMIVKSCEYWVKNHEDEDLSLAYSSVVELLNVLKELEPIAPVKVNRYMETDENGNWVLSETYDCGYCGGELHSKANYCHLCGRPVKRE